MRWTLTSRTSESDRVWRSGPLKSKSVKMRPLKWALPQSDWVPRRGTHTAMHTQREDRVRYGEAGGCLLYPEEGGLGRNHLCLCRHHHLGSGASRMERKYILLFKPPNPWYFVTARTRQANTLILFKVSFQVLSPSFHLLLVLPFFFFVLPSLLPLSCFLSTSFFSS